MISIIVPDLHYDLPWLGRIMEAEAPSPQDTVVFLGDYFDAFKPQSSAKRVCRTLRELQRAGEAWEGPKCVFLVGNHDLQYLALARRFKEMPRRVPREMYAVPHGCSGYSKSRAAQVILYADREWLSSLKLVHMEQGYLCSHAGVGSSFVKVRPRGMEGGIYGQLEEDAAAALASCHVEAASPWFWVGRDRGGSDPHGGSRMNRTGPSWRARLIISKPTSYTAMSISASEAFDSTCVPLVVCPRPSVCPASGSMFRIVCSTVACAAACSRISRNPASRASICCSSVTLESTGRTPRWRSWWFAKSPLRGRVCGRTSLGTE